VIVADTGAVLALLDADDRHHAAVRGLYEEQASSWLLPWAILPEVDYLALSQLGQRVEEAFLADLAAGGFRVEWGIAADLDRAHALCTRYRALKLGLVDAVVIAVAERRRAHAIATLDLRHFGTVRITGTPKLYPRDL
jgi:predicted nucleic acid-binding protein